MNFTQKEFYTNLTNAGVFLFFAGALILPSGYSWGAVALLLLALVYLGFNFKHLSASPKFIVYPVLIYFAATLASYLIFMPQKPIQLDLAGRIVLGLLVAIFLVRKKLNLVNIALAVALGGILAFTIAYYQVNIAQTHLRASGFIHTIMFGQISVLWAMLSLAGLLLFKKIDANKRQQWLFVIWLTLGFLGGINAAILSGSKGAWIVIPPALLVFFFVAFKKLPKKFFVLIFLSLAVDMVWIFSTNDIVKQRSIEAVEEYNRFQEDADSSFSSVGARLQMYKVGLLLFKENPFLGIGRDATVEEVAKLDLPESFKNAVRPDRRLHNDYIDLAAYYGLLVLIPFLFMLLVPAYYFGKRLFSEDDETKYLATSGFMVLVCYSLASLTDTLFQLNPGVMTYGFLMPIFASQLWRLVNLADA